MSIQEKQSRQLADVKQIRDLIKENIRLLQNDCVQMQKVQNLLVKYIKLKFNLKQGSEHEQQPLSRDMTSIDKNIQYLEERIAELLHAIEYGFDHLQILEGEIDKILNNFPITNNTDEEEQ